ncbi:MAG TPA: hypothetical protein VIU94_19330, partial [Streptomyces sp.]
RLPGDAAAALMRAAGEAFTSGLAAAAAGSAVTMLLAGALALWLLRGAPTEQPTEQPTEPPAVTEDVRTPVAL